MCRRAELRSGTKKPRDAQHDLMTQAVDGRIRGRVATRDDLFGRAHITQIDQRSHGAG
jgi:hypothetical protein